jgi:hypothetical protein
MSKHTPGPWEWRQSTEQGTSWHEIVGPLPAGLNPLLRDYVLTDTGNRHHCVDPDEDAANARLIAAAPELLEDLRNACALLTHALESDTVHVPDSDQSGHPHGWCAVRIPDWKVKQVIEWMNQNIAKAEGRDV